MTSFIWIVPYNVDMATKDSMGSIETGGAVQIFGGSSTAVNSFGTFLDTVQRGAHLERGGEDIQSVLLRFVAERGPARIADLVAATGFRLSEVLESLRILREFGLVALVGQLGDERVEATQSGASTASAIR
ncbi:MAG TPA: hypothetical protein VH370_26315 [Humisphaera sp.]|jgi:hypothetical protein|nr:hypothetical protein [Humisphaera sp.]